MLGTGNFPDFFGKYSVPGKLHSGTQTSTFVSYRWRKCGIVVGLEQMNENKFETNSVISSKIIFFEHVDLFTVLRSLVVAE